MADPAVASELGQLIALATGGSGIGISGVAAYILAKKIGWINGVDHATLDNQIQIMEDISAGHREQSKAIIKASERGERMVVVLEDISRNIAILVDRGHR